MKIHVYTDNDLYATSLSEKVIKSFLSRASARALSEKVIKSFLSRAPEFSGIIIVLDVIRMISSLF
jgi:hypothetical protein